jgi:hypothetical protein
MDGMIYEPDNMSGVIGWYLGIRSQGSLVVVLIN